MSRRLGLVRPAPVISVDPLLRRAFGFARRAPAWSLAVSLAVASFAAARATAPLVTDAAADRSFAAEAAAAERSARVGQGLDARAYTTSLADGAAAQAVSDLLDDLAVYSAPLVSVSPLLPYTDPEFPNPVIQTPDGREATAIVFAIGDASTSLTPAAGTAAPISTSTGIWVPDTVAAQLNLAPGDAVALGLRYPPADVGKQPMVTAATTIAGVYATANGIPVSATFDWKSLPASLPSDPGGGGGHAALLLSDTATAMALMATMGEEAFVKWDLAWRGPVSIEQGRDASGAVRRAVLQLQDPGSLIGRKVSAAHGAPVVLTSGVTTFVQRSEEAAATLEPVVSSIARTGQVMSVLVLVISIWLLSRARRREHALSLSMGANPVRLGLLAAVEQLIPIVVGVGASYVVVRWYPWVVAGDGAIDRDTIDGAVRAVLWAAPLAIGAVVVSGFGAVWPLDPSAAGRASRVAGAINAETVVVVAAVATGFQLVTQKGSALDSGTSLLFPLLAVLAGSVLVVRAAGMVIRVVAAYRRRRRGHAGQPMRRPRSLALWLARRRVSFSLVELSALVIVVAAGVGLFVYCSSISINGSRGVGDKAAALGGASATAQITTADQLGIGGDGFPADLQSGWTVVWTRSDAHLAPNVASDVLAVDPATFSSAAAWRDSFAGNPLSSLLKDLSESKPFTVDIVVAGNYTNTFPDNGTMELEHGAAVQYHIVDRIPAAPWLRERSSMVLVSARALAQALPAADGTFPATIDTAQLDRLFRTYVWSSGGQADLEAALGSVAVDVDTPNVATADRIPALVAFGLSLPYIRLVGIGLFAVALASIVVLGARRRTDLAIELALTEKMGMKRRTITSAVAGGAVLIGMVGSLIGIALAQVLVRFMIRRLDPSPSLAPKFSGPLSGGAVVAALVGVAIASLIAAWVELSGARRARIAEVLRGAE